ncbi:hypothetical protein N9995_00075 [bacterium]|nr:hypothetical protein [bacterium]
MGTQILLLNVVSYNLPQRLCTLILLLLLQLLSVDLFEDQTKAFGIRFSLICEYVQCCIIQINRIPRQRQLADIGTAARALPELERMMKEIYGEL